MIQYLYTCKQITMICIIISIGATNKRTGHNTKNGTVAPVSLKGYFLTFTISPLIQVQTHMVHLQLFLIKGSEQVLWYEFIEALL